MGRRIAPAAAALGLKLVIAWIYGIQGRVDSGVARPKESSPAASLDIARSLADGRSLPTSRADVRRATNGGASTSDQGATFPRADGEPDLHSLHVRLVRADYPRAFPRRSLEELEPTSPPVVRYQVRELTDSGRPFPIGGMLADLGGAVPVSSPRHVYRALDQAPELGAWRELEPSAQGSLHLPAGTWQVRPAPHALFAFQAGESYVVHVPTLTELVAPTYELARVRGVVVDANGHGVPGVRVASSNLPRPMDHPETAEDGSFAVRAIAGDVVLHARDARSLVEERCTLRPYEDTWIQLALPQDEEETAPSTDLVLGVEGDAPVLEVRVVQVPVLRPSDPDANLDHLFRTYGGVQPTDESPVPPYEWTRHEGPTTKFVGLQPTLHLVLARESHPDRPKPPIPLGLVELVEGEATEATLTYEVLQGPRLRGYVRGPVRAWQGTVALFPANSVPIGTPEVQGSSLPFDLVPPVPGRWLLAARINANCVWYAEEVTIGPGQLLEWDLRLPRGSLELWPEGPIPAGGRSHLVLHRLADGLDDLPYRRVACTYGRWRFDMLPTGRYEVVPDEHCQWTFADLPTFDVLDGELTTSRVAVARRVAETAR